MKALLSALVLTLTSAYVPAVLAWGGRGHDEICRAAVFLTKEEGLKDYLRSRPHMMGHLCNIPDTYWRTLAPEQTKLGNPTHFIDLELVGGKASEVNLDYAELTKQWTGKENPLNKEKKIENLAAEAGTLWWRADQFFRRAVALDADWKKTTPPANYKEESDDNFAYNKVAYDFVVNLGLMGHFVGDASMPFHGSADYDGYETGHGGIHSYYEDAGVAAMDADLETKVIQEGKKLQAKPPLFLTAPSVLEKMRALTASAYPEMEKVIAIDKVAKKSEKGEKGGKKVPAERPDIKKVAAQFEPMILSELGRSAALLASLWDEAYVKVGRPKLTVVKMYKYPLEPDFVAPDYIPAKK